VNNGGRPVRNPYVVLREEFDDWAVLFDPDTGRGFGLNPTGVYVWKLLDGEHLIDEMVVILRAEAEGVPDETRDQIEALVDALAAEGLAFAHNQGYRPEKSSFFPFGALPKGSRFTYQAPRLLYLGGGQEALGTCSGHGSHGGDCYSSGAGATGQCWCTGTCGSPPSCSGCCDSNGCSPTSTTPSNCCKSGGCPVGCTYGYTYGGNTSFSICYSGCSGSMASCTPCSPGSSGN